MRETTHTTRCDLCREKETMADRNELPYDWHALRLYDELPKKSDTKAAGDFIEYEICKLCYDEFIRYKRLREAGKGINLDDQ